MGVLLSAPWIAIALPLALALLVAVGGSRLAPFMRWVAMLGPLAVLAIGVASLGATSETGDVVAPFVSTTTAAASTAWIKVGDFALTIGYAVDALTAMMLIVVGFVALMVMMFSVGYMAGEDGIARYYALLLLFTASMTGLVLADGFVGLFVAWELVGACSYLLIGFWFNKPSAAAAAMKAFVVTRIGDVGLFVAIAILWGATGQTSYIGSMAALPGLSAGLVTAIGVLLFVGAAGKSAQFPLHTWLPDAMEGPTPVSALIHAATMVAAGVFLVARVWPIFAASPTTLTVVLFIGTFTALSAATIAVSQNDIKKVLAYSTISQLGFMFAALGAGAWRAALFLLIAHAAFKALLFLGSGSVIHGSGTQDMREMGGLAKKMPTTAVTWVVGAAALAGVPPLAGFFAKDEVLHGVLIASPVAFGALAVAAAFTAFYITRATVLTFFGSHRGSAHAHEGGASMLLPLVALAIPAATLGFAAAAIAKALGGEPEALSLTVAGISVAVATLGIVAGYLVYRHGPDADLALENTLGGVWRASRAGYFADTAADYLFVRPFVAVAHSTDAIVDRGLFDGITEGSVVVSRRLGQFFNRLQTGDYQGYMPFAVAGVVVLIALAITPGLLDLTLGWFGR